MMKKYIVYTIILLMGVFVTMGCEDYLAKEDSDGADTNIIYKDYRSMLGFLDRIYQERLIYNPLHLATGETPDRSHPGCMSDELATICNTTTMHTVTSGNWLDSKSKMYEIGCKGATTISKAYSALRIVNRVIADIDKVIVITEDEKKELLGQAHFLRAFSYFHIITRYGGMQFFDQVLQFSDDLFPPRKSYQESHEWMMTDLEKAIEYLPSQWSDEHIGRPNQLSALALKSMAQLYAASPLMQNGLDDIVNNGYDKESAKLAAQYAQATLDAVDAHPYHRLMDQSEYRDIFIIPGNQTWGQPEYLWYDRNTNYGHAILRTHWLTKPFETKTGTEGTQHSEPTQNIVDMFEREGDDGVFYPISDPRSGYSLQDPFSNRDPRLTNNILLPGEAWAMDKQNKTVYLTSYEGGFTGDFLANNSNTDARQMTSYFCKKFIWPEANNAWQKQFGKNKVLITYLRVGQVYLDFAEASFEATGSATAVVEGCSMSAVEALNIIRNRAGIGDLPSDYVSDPEKFREAYRRERAVELMFECNNRWNDIRRWMILEETFADANPIKGLKATPKNHGLTDVQLKASGAMYKEITEFDYEVVDVTTEVRNYTKRNYWYPLPMDDVAASNGKLKQNPLW